MKDSDKKQLGACIRRLRLAAAITPEEHKYLYFVAITDGGRHAFSTNLDDHNRAVRQYLKNRRAQRQQ